MNPTDLSPVRYDPDRNLPLESLDPEPRWHRWIERADRVLTWAANIAAGFALLIGLPACLLIFWRYL